MNVNATNRKRMITPSRYNFWETERVYGPLKEAINDRKLASLAASDFERRFHRRNMRFAARRAVSECRAYLRQIFA
jgi:hypothetical protein